MKSFAVFVEKQQCKKDYRIFSVFVDMNLNGTVVNRERSKQQMD